MKSENFGATDNELFDSERTGEDAHESMDCSVVDREHQYLSSMRLATDLSVDDKRSRRRNRKKKIIARRGAFTFLPVYCSNDLVHGSWWFVVGSILATVIPVVPLVDLFYPFLSLTKTTQLPLFADASTFALLIVSGFFFTIGSLAFVRATEEPPLRPLFAKVTIHLETDELLAAWLFLLGTVPFPVLMLVYIDHDHKILVYWGCFFISTFFVIATYLFVLTCYPSDDERNFQYAPLLSRCLFNENSCMHKHLSNDWLATTWIFFFATLVLVFGSIGMLFLEMYAGGNNLEIFDWASG